MSNKMALDALTAIAEMDPQGIRGDDLGRAARTARAAIAALQAEPVPANERNAARYVWLREHLSMTILRVLAGGGARGLYCGTYAQQLDGVIDEQIDALPSTPPKD